MAAIIDDECIWPPIREMLKGFVGWMGAGELHLPFAVRGRKAQDTAYRLACGGVAHVEMCQHPQRPVLSQT